MDIREQFERAADVPDSRRCMREGESQTTAFPSSILWTNASQTPANTAEKYCEQKRASLHRPFSAFNSWSLVSSLSSGEEAQSRQEDVLLHIDCLGVLVVIFVACCYGTQKTDRWRNYAVSCGEHTSRPFLDQTLCELQMGWLGRLQKGPTQSEGVICNGPISLLPFQILSVRSPWDEVQCCSFHAIEKCYFMRLVFT